MMRRRLHIGWLLAISCWLLAVGCSSDETGEKKPTLLTIYVYSPEHPMLIRGAVGPVDSKVEESRVNQLQIWIFESGTGRKVGYLNTSETSLLNTSEGATYQIIVDDAFAQNKPDVDIYVLANISSSYYNTVFNENSTREEIRENATLDASHFGLYPLCNAVPSVGLPMVGILKNQSVVGNAPVLRIGTQSNIATVSLTRAVSKLRFVFANTENAPTLHITRIELDAGMVPNVEYLIPQTRTLTYNSSIASLFSSGVDVVEKPDPTAFIYNGQEAQTYETLIDESALTTVGPYYLHESDKQLSGKIYFTLGDGGEQYNTFQMEAAGDFLRNHIWIVYAYHAGGGYLQLNTLYIKDWNNKTVNHEVYNW